MPNRQVNLVVLADSLCVVSGIVALPTSDQPFLRPIIAGSTILFFNT